MKQAIYFNGISSVDELLENNLHLLQIVINRGWFPNEPDLDVEVHDHVHIEGDPLDVVQFTAHRKNQKPLVPFVVNASINQCRNGTICLVPILILDSRKIEYFSTKIYQTGEIFDGVVNSVSPSIDMGLKQRLGKPDIHLVGLDFHVTYQRPNGKDSKIEANIPSLYCLVEQNNEGLWVPFQTIWN